MATMAINDLDYLTVRLHARRSRMAEGERLDGLCRTRSVSDLSQAVGSGHNFSNAADFQRRLLADHIQEYTFCLRHLGGAEQELARWMQTRFQIENIKVLLRGWLNHVPLDHLSEHLVPLPRELAVDAPALLTAETVAAFAKKIPVGLPRKNLERALGSNPDQSDTFIFEAALDAGFFHEWCVRTARLVDEEKELIEPLVRHQVEQFHLLLVARGRFNHGYSSETLMALRVPSSGASAERFEAMLAATDLSALARLGVGHAFDKSSITRAVGEEAVVDPAEFELLASRRLLRLANHAFRRSHVGFATVVAYLEIRRIEVANLITLSEGIRLHAAPEIIRARLTRRARGNPEVQHV